MRGAQRRGNLPGPGKQSGYLLLPVAIAIALIGLVGFMISSESALETNLAAGELEMTRAEYVAQAGLQHALRETARQGCGPYTDLNNVPFGNDLYGSSLTTDLGSTSTYTLPADQDDGIVSAEPDANNGGSVKLNVSYDGVNEERALIRFDLSALPAKAVILSATLRLRLGTAHNAGALDIHRVTTDWLESDATWNNMYDQFASETIASIAPPQTAGVWVSANLTSLTQSWVNGQPNYGVIIKSSSVNVSAKIDSSESAYAPYLEVVVGVPPTPQAQLKAVGILANGAKRTIFRESVGLSQAPGDYMYLQPGDTDGKDAFVTGDKPTWNFGAATFLRVRAGGGGHWHSFIQFDLSRLPHGARVVSAQMDLYRQVNPGDSPGRVEAYPVSQSWVEGDSNGGANPGVTFDYRDTALPWTNSGGDYAATPVASFDVTAATDIWYSLDITPFVRQWTDRTPNHGLVLIPGDNNVQAEFASSEHADPARRPKLSVTYSCECGSVCAAPQGSGNILMVVINPTTLVAEDQKAKDLFESWGYTVNVISESANQATFDTGFVDNDVIFVSETVNSNTLGSKLANAPIGVVSQDGDYNADLGLASGSAYTVGSAIDITGNDHFITRPFATGTLAIYAAAMEQLTIAGSINADQEDLTASGGVPSLIALDAGDEMQGGGSAAGRRVMLPLGTRYRFDWDYLNANGRLLVHRALAWGLGAAKTGAGDVLLVVPDPAALGVEDTARRALIESWDYSVTLIDDDADQTDFDTAVAANDVVYVPSTVDEVALAGKLGASGRGIVFEQHKLVQEFGLADATDTGSVTSSIDIVDNTHYVTEPFALGALTIFDTANETRIIQGMLAPGLQPLAEDSGKNVLDALDIGAIRYDSTPSLGRRIKLPWGQVSFDPAWLNADGETLMRRALEWTGSAGGGDYSNDLLFVVPSPGSLDPTDTAKQALFESWGYTVNQIDDDAPLADFQSATVVNGVAYVSATAVAASVGSKLFKANIGVVNANTGLHDDFGFSTVRFVASTNAPMNTVASHYITQPFGGGQVTLYTSDQASGGAVGTLAVDLDQIGIWSSGALSPLGGLVTLEAGAMTSIGETTPARRAQMPWDSLDVSTLSANGLTILQRALEWAGGAEIDLSPFAHWKLDDGIGMTAIDSEGSNDGTLVGPPAWVAGLIGDALQFDGSNDYVDAGTFDVVGSGITMMAWFNADAIATDDGRFVSKASGPNAADAYWQLSTTDSGTNRYLRMRIKAGGSTTTLADSSVNLSTGTWYLAAATYDNASGTMRLYLNGAEVASTAHAIGGTLDTNASVPVALGANGTAERFFNGILDDVRIYNRALDASEISDLYAASAPPEPGYTGVYQPWSAANDDIWETFDLGAFGVPADAVVEVALVNNDTSKEQWAGVRAVGSGLERRFLLHEAEGGGADVITLHVQADADGRIQHYTSKKGTTSFVLLGYWTTGSYVELYQTFGASSSNTWVIEDVSDEGLGPNQVAEIVLQNTNGGAERLAGVRVPGLGLQRRFLLHEAEAGGVEAVSMMVNTDGSSRIQVYAQTVSDIDFHVVGYWDTPPGVYTEQGGVHGQAVDQNIWETADLSAFGVPANSIAQFVLSNEVSNFDRELGVRRTGSGDHRAIRLQEAEAGGSENSSMHVNVDAGAQIEWYSQDGTSDRYFYPVGWWLLP